MKHTLNEKEAKVIIRQVFNGLYYLSSQAQKVIHYDLKPGNILFHKGQVKITDFGLSKIIREEASNSIELTSQGAGTYWYLPPECFNKKNPRISSKVDVWSCGIILYQLLYGKKPFGDGQTPEEIISHRSIHNATGEYIQFPNTNKISIECQQFIRSCLTQNVELRPDVKDVFNLPFLKLK